MKRCNGLGCRNIPNQHWCREQSRPTDTGGPSFNLLDSVPLLFVRDPAAGGFGFHFLSFSSISSSCGYVIAYLDFECFMGFPLRYGVALGAELGFGVFLQSHLHNSESCLSTFILIPLKPSRYDCCGRRRTWRMLFGTVMMSVTIAMPPQPSTAWVMHESNAGNHVPARRN